MDSSGSSGNIRIISGILRKAFHHLSPMIAMIRSTHVDPMDQRGPGAHLGPVRTSRSRSGIPKDVVSAPYQGLSLGHPTGNMMRK